MADLGQLVVEKLVESTDLLSGGTLVLIKESTELATSTDGCRVTLVGELGDASQLGIGAAVHTELDCLVASNLARHHGDLTRETGLLVLDSSDGAGNASGKHLTGIGHLLGSLGAGSSNVLHSLGEAGVGKSSLLGNAIVDALHSTSECSVSGSALLGHVDVQLAELAAGTALSSTHGLLHGTEGSTEASGRSSVGLAGGSLGLAAGRVDLGGEGVHVGLHGSINILGLLGEGICVGSHLGVGLLDLLGSLDLKGEEGAVHGTHSILEGALGSLLAGSNAAGNGGTASSVLASGMSLLGVGNSECNLGHLHSSDEVLLSLGGSGTHSVQELTTHLSASLLGAETQVLNLGGRLLGKLGHLRGDTHVEGSLGLLVEGLELHLGLHHADLTLVHSTLHGSLELHLVGLHDGSELGAALGVLHSVGTHDASELVHLTLELLVVADNVGVESGHTLGEVILGRAELISDVETSITGLGSELAIDLHLGLLTLGNGGVQLAGLLGKHVCGMGTVLLHGGTHFVQLGGVVVSHGLEAGVSGSLVALDQSLKLTVLLQVLLVALVTELDHAVHLSVHIGVDLSLGGLVLGHSVGELINTQVGLVDLVLHGGRQGIQVGLEGGLGSSNAGLGLGLGSSDVLDSLGETLVVERLEGVQGGSHLGRGSLQGEVSGMTVGSHLFAHTAELGSGGSHDDLHLVVGPLAEALVLGLELSSELGAAGGSLGASVGSLLVEDGDSLLELLTGLLGVLLNLSGIDGDVLVGLGNARIHSRGKGGHGALLGQHLSLKVLLGLLLVSLDNSTDVLGAGNVGLVTLVLELGHGSELTLDKHHRLVKVILGLLGVHSHLVEERLLQLRASGLVEGEVACHLGAHGSNIALTGGLLGSNLLLDVGQVVGQAHATVRGVGEDGA